MKKLLSAFMIASTLSSAIYTPKSEAGILFVAGGAGVLGSASLANYNSHERVWGNTGGSAMIVLGVGAVASGIVMLAHGNFLGFIPLVLSEDGSASKEKLAAVLIEKHSFLTNEEASDLAYAIKVKADKMEIDAEGKKMVSLSEAEVKSALASSELSEEHLNLVITDLK